MRKNIFFIGILAAFCTWLLGCGNEQADWQKVDLGACGEMKIPGQWQYYTQDDILYMLDENSEPVMIECETHEFYMFGTSNKIFSDFRYENFVSSAGLSNSAIYGKEGIIHQGVEKEVLYLTVGVGNNEKHFIVWDETLSEEELEEIAQTYSLPDETE